MARRDPLEVLLQLTRTLARGQSLQEALQATTDAALEVLPGDHTSLRLLDETRSELLSTARSGAGAASPPAPFRAGEGILGLVAAGGTAIRIDDTATDPRFAERTTGFTVRSILAVPLVAAGQVMGVLSASSSRLGAFGERDVDLAQLLSNCTAPAIEKARLAHLAVTDDLTRAYNYRVRAPRLAEEISRAERYGESFSVLMMDLDHFKRVNDEHGHAAGDAVLRGFADRVRGEVRSVDVLIRRGGEEFLLLMPSTSGEVAGRVAERIRRRVAGCSFPAPSGREVALTVSIGVATWLDGEDASALEARADAALYEAKSAGRDRVQTAPPPAPRRGMP